MNYYENTETGEIVYITDKDIKVDVLSHNYMSKLLYTKLMSHSDFDWEIFISKNNSVIRGNVHSNEFSETLWDCLITDSNWVSKHIIYSPHPEIRTSIRNGEMDIIIGFEQMSVKLVGDKISIVSRYHPSGDLKRKISYYKHRVIGSVIDYNGDGRIMQKQTFNRNSLLHGESVEYYFDGSIRNYKKYINGRLTGVSYQYWKNGNLSLVRIMKNYYCKFEISFSADGTLINIRELYPKMGNSLYSLVFSKTGVLSGAMFFGNLKAKEEATLDIEKYEYLASLENGGN